ncbi:ParE toxin of type II toxin-antitoxin system, parDE [Rubritalea squalenifaciens DSM 18772]|uniref:ParE toxin of type II toxin-antitoxin system, parDE n=1 Tax=Rubritalea squalenifaciens DSM 18772 TaxID=1123071 RepID=A0A1M6QXN3_9BACT|nr:type II toxin-antitoxin system RelE/ParE family toxin [Rubritalea squalenifaciens]SHK24827.1 ParE toxin of type II toxin-antitoxin system, parDE [Rubritalea squalenifaciens DSM 18772]
MRIEFISEAREDFLDAIGYYESMDQGLGLRLRDEVAFLLETVSSAPLLWRERKGGYRRVNSPISPYYIAYVIRDETIVIIALASNHRKPNYWHKRI